MTDSTEAITDTSLAPAPATEVAHRNTRLYQVPAWVGIVAGILFIVGAVFVSGFLAGRTADGQVAPRRAERPDATRRPDGRRLPDDADAAWRHGTRRHDARMMPGAWDRVSAATEY